MFKRIKSLFKSPQVYSESEFEAIDKHINTYFGKCDKVMHEIVSPDIHVDVYLIEPTNERNYYSYVTCGMGAFHMNTPKDCRELSRAELVIAFPPDWKIHNNQEKWLWPFRLLKAISHLPIESKSWVGWGHTIQFGKGFCGDTGFEGALLLTAASGLDGCEICNLPNGERVNFYQVIPVYQAEMDFKQEYGTEALLDFLFSASEMVVNPARCSVIGDGMEPLLVCMDDGSDHLAKIAEKNLLLDDLAAYQHMAIFLRWLIERHLLCNEFLQTFSDTTYAIQSGQWDGDLRTFIRDDLEGVLTTGFLTEEGDAFARWYYGYQVNEDHYYPCDVDRYALELFGEEKFNSPEYQDEAYLFIPWNEDYYQAIAVRIENNYQLWKQEVGARN